MSIELILPEIVKVLKGVTPPKGQKTPTVYEYPPDSPNVPAFVPFPKQRTLPWPRNPMTRNNNRQVDILLLFPEHDTAADSRAIVPWEQMVIAAFDNHISLGGMVNACGVTTSAGPTQVMYGEQPFRGYIFTLTIEDQETIVYQP